MPDSDSPFWKKAENFHAPSITHQVLNSSIYDAKFHGSGGPIDTSYSASYGASHQHWHKTLQNLGVNTNPSHFSGSNIGAWTTIAGIYPEKQERSYSAVAYYRPNSERNNLVLLTEAVVREIVLEQAAEAWSAKGARFSHSDGEYVVQASQEIILCGGSISSPQILELSGIGDPDRLKAAGVDCKVANPNVGENLQDHMMTAMVYEIDPTIVTPDDLRADPALAATADEEYKLHATGPRTAIPSSVAYLPFASIISTPELSKMTSKLPTRESETSYPYQHHDAIISSRLTSPQDVGQIEFFFDISNYSPCYQSQPGKKYATMLMMLQYPFSRGSIHVPPTMAHGNGDRKATSDDKPLIDPQYFGGEGGKIDFECMVRSQRFADKICRTKPLNDIIVKRVYPPEPEVTAEEQHANGENHVNDAVGSNDHVGGENKGDHNAANSSTRAAEDFSDWVRDTTMTDWHPMGTCAMGPSIALGGVVDSRLRVHGVKSLRVCDASVMPLQIGAHLQATVYAIGEKGAAMIKEDMRQYGN